MVGLVAVVNVHGHALDACDNAYTCLNGFLVKNQSKNMCHTYFVNSNTPLAVVGPVAIVVVHGHALNACDNLESCFLDSSSKVGHRTCAIC